ncbi:Ger(x)C family spore germination protein [Paenibacillus thailandensis]|uniref:Ger(X)C family spore germination protein n=1 Tax=Paenibacillus thailandensis TaxID=393250 RepID=A0ABW5QRW9_9BACL
MKRVKKYGLPLMIALMAVFASGCWNSRELRDMSIVIGMGIDAVPDSQQYRVSFQIVNSGAMQAAGSSQGGANMLPIVVFNEKADTLFGALRKVSRKVPRRLFFGHIQVVVIGESIARKGMPEVFDFFERAHEIRMNSAVLIARDATAEKVISIITPLERLSAIGIAKRTRMSSHLWAENADSTVHEVVREIVGPGVPVIGGIRVFDAENAGQTTKNLENSKLPSFLKVQGLSLLREGKLAGWLDGRLARGALLLRKELKNTVYEVPCGDSGHEVVVSVARSRVGVKPKLEQGKLTFAVDIMETGSVVEANCALDPGRSETLEQLQKQWEKLVEQEVTEAVKAAQEKQSDIFGFGTTVRHRYPEQWKTMEKDWPKRFAESGVEVHVDMFLRRTGMRGETFKEEQSK